MYSVRLRICMFSILSTIIFLSSTTLAQASYSTMRSKVDNDISNLLIRVLVLNTKQIHSVHGTVTDSDGKPLIGVSIKVENENEGTVTNNNGEYTIENVSDSAVLVFSYIGFIKHREPVRRRSSIDVVLLESKQKLNELIVTGYSTQKRKDITGSIDVVNVDAMKSIPTGSAVQALQGLASGVNIIRTGQAGSPSTIHVRGIGSFGNNSPLVLVDGVEANLEDINPQNIKSIQVLKDAGSAAIYGVRGANGVILVTTKKGESIHPVVTYEGYYSIQEPLHGNPFNLLNNTEEYARLFMIAFPESELFKNGVPDYLYGGPGVKGTAMEGDPAVDPSKYVNNPKNPSNNYLIEKVNKAGTDWFHEVFKPASQQQHSLTVSGKTERINYLFNVNYLNEQNTLIRTYLKR